jgi:hypothetical protein
MSPQMRRASLSVVSWAGTSYPPTAAALREPFNAGTGAFFRPFGAMAGSGGGRSVGRLLPGDELASSEAG